MQAYRHTFYKHLFSPQYLLGTGLSSKESYDEQNSHDFCICVVYSLGGEGDRSSIE